MTTLTSTPCYNPFIIDNRSVSEFIFYNDEGIVYKRDKGFFGYNRRDAELYIGDATHRKKENLTRKENFWLSQPKEYSFETFGRAKVYLYVDGKDIQVTFGEEYQETTDTLTYVYKNATIKIYDKTFEEKIFVRAEKNDFGQYVDNVSKELKDENIDIDTYVLKELLKKYNLVKK